MDNAKPKLERIERIITPMPTTLIEEIDDFRFGNRIPSRSQAIRELIRRGLTKQTSAELLNQASRCTERSG